MRIYLFLYIVYPTKLGFCSGWTVDSAAKVLQSIPIGWALYLKDFIISPTSSCKKVCCCTFWEKWAYSVGVGNSPKRVKNAVSKKLAF